MLRLIQNSFLHSNVDIVRYLIFKAYHTEVKNQQFFSPWKCTFQNEYIVKAKSLALLGISSIDMCGENEVSIFKWILFDTK